MGSEDAFCLKWNDFQGSISTSLGSLRSPSSTMQDVTLQCGTESLKAHKLVLALCSDWFRKVLESLPVSTLHPVIVMWDASPGDMALVCDFMYHGQVNVQQERLPSFLALASRLAVKGLSQSTEESAEKHGEDIMAKVRKEERVQGEKEALPGPVVPVYDVEVEEGRVKEEQEEDTSYPVSGLDYSGLQYEGQGQYIGGQGGYQGGGPEEEPGNLVPAEFSPKGGGHCPVCQKRVAKLAYHMEDVHYPVDTPCPICGKVFSSLNKMRSHKSSQHRAVQSSWTSGSGPAVQSSWSGP